MMEILNNIGNSLRVSWPAHVVDILIVAFLIYQALKLVRETRAFQLVKGIILILLVYLLSTWLQLKTMSFIMNNLLSVGIIALVVLFQPEMRRALEQMGRTQISKLGVFGNQSDGEELVMLQRSITAVDEACSVLSKQKTGALIVYERKTLLGEIIKTGTVINAEPTMELIRNVFFPNAPMHDGALIIRGGRPYSAGCFLPLSENHEISRELGTRHRAALGMSENSDAVVVVVSEETGYITVAMNGVLQINLTPEQLDSLLRRELLPPEEEAEHKPKTAFWRRKND